MNCLRFGLLLPCLLLHGGCSKPPLTQVETLLLIPPAALLADCPQTPVPDQGTNADLLEIARMLRIDLAECNHSKERLRQWIHMESQGMERK